MTGPKVKISVHGVARTFTGSRGEKVEALRDVNLEIEDEFSADGKDIGEFRVLVGPSGTRNSPM